MSKPTQIDSEQSKRHAKMSDFPLDLLNTELRKIMSMVHEDTDIAASILEPYRKLTLIQLLYDHLCVAVTGVQGVGKSTLVKNLLGIDEPIFPMNLGRGEKIPLLVVPKEGGSISRSILTLEGKNWDKVMSVNYQDAGEFNTALMDPKQEMLIARVEIPDTEMKFWVYDVSFLLLPGIEERGEPEWRELVKNASIAATSCIVAFNSTTYSQHNNKQFIDWIRSNLDSSDLILAMTRGDESSDNNDALRVEVQKDLFDNDSRTVSSIVSVGDDESNMEWRHILRDAILRLTRTRVAMRKHQYGNLYKILNEQLSPVMKKVEDYETSAWISFGEQRDELQNFVKPFHDERVRVRAALDRELERRFAIKTDTVAEIISKDMSIPPLWKIGLKNIENFFTNSERVRRELREYMRSCWENQGEDNGEIFQRGVEYALPPSVALLKPRKGERAPNSPFPDDAKPLVLDDVYSDMRILFRGADEDKWNNMGRTLELLPHLVLNLSMLSQRRILFISNANLPSAEVSAGDFKSMTDSFLRQPVVLNAIGMVMGIDAAFDGKIDSVPTLLSMVTGVTVKSIPAWVSIAMTSVLTSSILIANITSWLRRAVDNEISLKTAFVHALARETKNQLLQSYDDAMDALQAHLISAFSRRHNFDDVKGQLEMLAHRRKLAKSHARKVAETAYDNYHGQ